MVLSVKVYSEANMGTQVFFLNIIDISWNTSQKMESIYEHMLASYFSHTRKNNSQN